MTKYTGGILSRRHFFQEAFFLGGIFFQEEFFSLDLFVIWPLFMAFLDISYQLCCLLLDV